MQMLNSKTGSMQKDSPIFEDIARLAGSAVGGLHDIKREMEAQVESRVRALLMKMDLVTREEFEVVRAMAIKSREEQEALEARLAALEQQTDTAGARP